MSKQLHRLRETGGRATAIAAAIALALVGTGVPTALAQSTDPAPATAEVMLGSDVEESTESTDEVTVTEPTAVAEDVATPVESAAEDSAASSDSNSEATTADQAPTVEPADAPVAQAAGTAGTATGLALTVLRDGTPNADGSWDADDSAGNDSSETNGIVRTHDSVVYRWGWSVATAGDVTLTQTLPEGMSWVVAESTAACAEGADAVSADGRTMTCTRADQATGSATYQVRAMVDYAANGQVLSSVLSSAGAADSAPAEVTASAAPKMDVQTAIGGNGYTVVNGEGGQLARMVPILYVPIDSNRGLRGTEALADEFTFTMDVSNYGPNAVVTACSSDGGSYGFGTSITGNYTAENALPDVGTWTCTQDAPGQPITVTVKDAITDARTYPTVAPSGATLPAGRAYTTTGVIAVWMPQSDYPEERTLSLQLTDFDPVSVSGQSNYGAGYANGYTPGSGIVGGVNGGTFTFSLAASTSAGMGRVYGTTALPNYTTPVAEGATSVVSGDAPMYPGTTLRFGGYAGPMTSDGSPVTNFTICAAWDETTMTGGSVITGLTPTTVEYSHIDATTDDQRKAFDCGIAGDGAAGWSTTKDGVDGGADAVNVVRYSWASLASNVTPYTGVELTRTDKELTAGTPMPVFFQTQGDNVALTKSGYVPTATNGSHGARALAADAQTSVEIAWDGATSDPGLVRTVTVQPTASTPSGAGGVAKNATVDVTIPSTVSLIAGSWPAANAPTSTVVNANGSTTYTFPLGDLAANEVADALTFQVGIGSRIEMPTTITLTAVISSDGDARGANYRTDTADIVVNSPAAFSASKVASSSFAVPGVPVTYTVSWLNGLEATVGVGKVVDILPFVGDGRGTAGLEGVALGAVAVTADMAVTVQYTTDASAAVTAAVAGDRSGDTGITWVDSDTPPSNATALRFVTGDIDPGQSGEALITVTPGAVSTSGVVVNDLSGKVELVAQPIENVAPVELPSGAVSMSGTVYDDVDYSWGMDAGDAGIAGVTVLATGYTFGANGIDDGGAGDDQKVSAANATRATTGSDGTFTIDGLAPGSWTVAVDGDVSGMRSAEVQEAVSVQPTQTATDLNLGYIVPVDAPVLVDDVVRVSAGDSVEVEVLANDTFDASGVISAVGTPTAGTAVESNGVITYTAGSTAGTESFTYTVTDKARQSATATVTVEVVALPSALNSTVTIGQESTAIDLSGLFTGDGASIAVTQGTVSGSLVTYTPSGPGTFTFDYTVTDSMGKTASATVTVIVLQAPDLVDDAASTTNTTPVTVAVTANDVFVGTGSLAVASGPSHGTVVVEGTGIVYTPVAGFVGTDSFTYSVTDEAGQFDTATVTVTVADPIALVDDVATTGEGMAVTVDVLANDVASAGEITAVTQGASGSVAVVDGKVVYTPGAYGTDSFTYTVTDSIGAMATATVSITVLQAPDLADDAVSTLLETAVRVAVGGNDPFVGTGTLAVASGPSHGTAVVDGADIVYTPAAGFLGTDTFTYSVTDSVGQSDTATVTVTVVEEMGLSEDSAITGQDTAVTIDVLANDVATGGVITAVTQGADGTVEVTGGKVVYTPGAGFFGTDTFTYTVEDNSGATGTATVTVTVLRAPELADDVFSTLMDQAITLDVAANDPFVGTGVMSVSASAHGTATVEGGFVRYTPADGFLGTDTFTYTVSDAAGQEDTATVTITVVEEMTLTADSARTGEQTAVTVDVLANDVATGGVITAVTQGADGTVEVTGGKVVYTPAAGFAGTDTFTYTVTDLSGATATATATITVVARPVAEDIALRTGLNTPVSVPAAARTTGDALTAELTTAPVSGALVMDQGVGIYTPAAGFIGTDSMVLTWTDSVGQTVTQEITVEVVDAPVANDDWAETTLDTVVSIDLLANDQGEALTVTAIEQTANGTVSVDADGVLTFTPATGVSGSTALSYTVTDAVGQTATATVVIDVYGLPSAPDLTARTGVGMAVLFDPLAPATRSLTSSTVSITSVGTTVDGVATLNEDGTITFAPASDFVGTTSFTYAVIDHLGQTAEGTLTVEVVALLATGEITVETAAGEGVSVDVLSVVEGSHPTILSLGTAGHGTLEIVDGQVVYTPADGFSGSDTFTVTVQDDLGQTATVTVHVTVVPQSTDEDEIVDGPGTSDQDGPADPVTPDRDVLAWTGTAWVGLAGLALGVLVAGVALVARSRRGGDEQH